MGRIRIRTSGGSDGFSSGGVKPGFVLTDVAPPFSALGRAVRHAMYVRQPRADDGDLPTSSAQPFDHYIATAANGGSDTNLGTLASPWAITSLQGNNANNPKMAGKRVGLLPGTYPMSSL